MPECELALAWENVTPAGAAPVGGIQLLAPSGDRESISALVLCWTATSRIVTLIMGLAANAIGFDIKCIAQCGRVRR